MAVVHIYGVGANQDIRHEDVVVGRGCVTGAAGGVQVEAKSFASGVGKASVVTVGLHLVCGQSRSIDIKLDFFESVGGRVFDEGDGPTVGIRVVVPGGLDCISGQAEEEGGDEGKH